MSEASIQVWNAAEPTATAQPEIRQPDFLLRFEGSCVAELRPLRNEALVRSFTLADFFSLEEWLASAAPREERSESDAGDDVPKLIVVRVSPRNAARVYDVHLHLGYGERFGAPGGELHGWGYVLPSGGQSAGVQEIAYLLKREDEALRRERRLRVESEALLTCIRVLMSRSGIEEKCKCIFEAFTGALEHRHGFVFRRASRDAFVIAASTHDHCIGSTVRAEAVEWLFSAPVTEELPTAELLTDFARLGLADVGGLVLLGAPIRIDRETALMAVLKPPANGGASRDRMLFERLIALTSQAIESEERKASITELGRLAALGDLLSFVAHEINQPLSTIAMSAQNALTLCERSGDLEAVRPRLERIKTFALRAGETVQHVRALVYPAKARPFQASSKFAEVVGSVVNLLREGLERNGIDLQVDLHDPDATVRGHPVSLQQILLNLIVNARDAIRERQSRDGNGFEQWIHVTLEADAGSGCLALHVADSGGGIPSDVIPRIFDKFYTMKESGAGTGLGLAIVHELVSEIGGSIQVMNGPLGAVFTILLPKGDELDELEGASER